MKDFRGTPGPWKQGITLRTRQTAGWSKAKLEANDEAEQRCVFSNFTAADEGRSRRLVARCETKEDAAVITTLPAFHAAARPLVAALDPTAMDNELVEVRAGDLQALAAVLAQADGEAE